MKATENAPVYFLGRSIRAVADLAKLRAWKGMEVVQMLPRVSPCIMGCSPFNSKRLCSNTCYIL